MLIGSSVLLDPAFMKYPKLSLQRKSGGDYWLHIANKPGKPQASINLGCYPLLRDGTESIVKKALDVAIETGPTWKGISEV